MRHVGGVGGDPHRLLPPRSGAPTASSGRSIDGIGAYDHVHRAAMLSRLAQMPTANRLLPFVALAYMQPSSYIWEDAEGACHTVGQEDRLAVLLGERATNTASYWA